MEAASHQFSSYRSVRLTEEEDRELQRGSRILFKARKKQLSKRAFLTYASQIRDVIFFYRFAKAAAEERSKSTLGEIDRPISEVIAKLQQSDNIPDILFALGPLAKIEFDPDDEFLQRAVARYENLLRDLRNIKDMVLPPPETQKGKPKAHNLYSMVDRVAHIWERFTGKEFKQLWKNGEPISIPAQFVHAIVKVADPNCLKKLPSVAARTVTNRNSRKRRQSASRKRASSHL
jgi:hypothetical protein